MLSPEDVDLIAGFKKVSELMPGIAFDFVMDTLPPEKEHEFGQILILLGDLLSQRAEGRGLPGELETDDETSGQTDGAKDVAKRSTS